MKSFKRVPYIRTPSGLNIISSTSRNNHRKYNYSCRFVAMFADVSQLGGSYGNPRSPHMKDKACRLRGLMATAVVNRAKPFDWREG